MSKVDDIQYNFTDIMVNRIIAKLKNTSDNKMIIYFTQSNSFEHCYEYSIFFTKANEFG